MRNDVEIRVLGVQLPGQMLPWVALNLIAKWADEISSAQLVQAAKGSLEIQILRGEIRETSLARYEYDSYLGHIAHEELLQLDAELAVLAYDIHKYPEDYGTL